MMVSGNAGRERRAQRESVRGSGTCGPEPQGRHSKGIRKEYATSCSRGRERGGWKGGREREREGGPGRPMFREGRGARQVPVRSYAATGTCARALLGRRAGTRGRDGVRGRCSRVRGASCK